MTIPYDPSAALLATLHPSVDQVSWKCFNAEFERRYRKARGNDFQDLFRRIMRWAHGERFAEVRPHGSMGDYSCDGYLRTTRTVFACYAPKSTSARPAAAVAKVRQDHAGALEHWKSLMSEWKLVHNEDDGLPPHLVQLLEELQASEPEVAVGNWNIENVRPIVQGLRRADLTDLFGPQLSLREMVGLSHADIKAVVDDLATLVEHREGAALSLTVDVRQVPPAKMAYNHLSVATREFLGLGEHKAPVVQGYFEGHTDPLLAGKIASRFEAKYSELKGEGRTPDDIFVELQVFSGYFRHPTHQMGALSLLAYLFETCHIFERPRDLHHEGSSSAPPDEDAVSRSLVDRDRRVDPDPTV